tara:strand:+ start:172 stop:1692 length:1521 start_codon:yes stop_codon:yes gene_type:complete
MKLFQQLLVAGAALSFVAPMASQASSVNLDDMKSYSNSSNSAGFSNDYLNIEPGDFIHQSINDLAASRGCSVDISDRSISRFEAATIVNSCLGNVAEVTTIERSLIDEFSSELALIRGRIDGIEARLSEFEAGTFSSTTTLDGKAVFAIGAVSDGSKLGESATSKVEREDEEGVYDDVKTPSMSDAVTFAYVYQMNLNTSFTGDDNLYVRLKTSNGWDNFKSKPGTYHNEAGSGKSILTVDKIWYTFPIGDKVTATVGPKIENYYMLAATPSVYKPKVLKAFRFGGHGAAFGASTSTGAGLKYEADNGFATSITVNSKGASGTNGFLTEQDENKINVMAAYTADNYHLSATYTTQSNNWDAWHYYSTDSLDDDANLDDADGWALRTWWRPDETGTAVPSVSIGYDTMSFTNHLKYSEASGYSVGLNWSDMFQAGDTIGLALGQPIKGTETVGATKDDVDPFLWEAYYSFKPNDSIEITPGIFGGSDVRSDEDDDIFGAVLTTTFRF